MVAFSEETQDVFIKATLNFRIDDSDIQTLFTTVGPDYFNKLIRPRVLQIFKDTTVKFKAVDIAPSRELIREEVRERLRTELAPSSIEVVDLLIDDIDFQPAFKSAIEAKQVATQDAQREEERIVQATNEAQQLVERSEGDAEVKRQLALGDADALRTAAQADADAARLRAGGEADALREIADGQRDANLSVNPTLTENVLTFETIKKIAPTLDLAFLPSEGNIILDLQNLAKTAPSGESAEPDATSGQEEGG